MKTWQLVPKVREELLRKLCTGRKLPKWLTLGRETNSGVSFWVAFDGIILDNEKHTVTLLSGSKAVATVEVPKVGPGNSLTLMDSGFKGRLKMKLESA